MTSDIRFFADGSFSFRSNGQTFRVHTEVTEGAAARVVVEEVQPEPITEAGE